MKNHSGIFPVKKMAEIFSISRSRYYSWLTSPSSAHKRRDNELLKLIKDIFEENRETYGSPRVHRDLGDQGSRCSRKRVARLMRENGIKARQKRKFKATTDSGHDFPVAPNLVNREFEVEVPNKVWVSDITYIWTMEGWLYLCIILDLCSRKAVGWSIEARITTSLTVGALSMAATHRKPAEGLVFHSDRGVQYAAEAFRKCLGEYKMIQSMSRKGDCWDNACAESFFATLKTEEVFHRKYKTREEARNRIFEYIVVFYNRKRRHSFLDFQSPEDFESQRGWLQHVA
jgi:putative transposase